MFFCYFLLSTLTVVDENSSMNQPLCSTTITFFTHCGLKIISFKHCCCMTLTQLPFKGVLLPVLHQIDA